MSILVRHGKQYCVYTHGIDGVVFWVGHGSPVRAFEHHGGRNKDWQKKVTQDYVVDIVSWHDSRKEAQAAEDELIIKLQPECNRMGTSRFVQPSAGGKRGHHYGSRHMNLRELLGN